MSPEQSSEDPSRDPDEGPGVVSTSVNKAESGSTLSGPGGRPITDDVPEPSRTEPHRLEDAAPHDGTGQSEKQ